MQHIRTLTTSPQPWRNGGGTTRDIAAEQYDDDGPGWRISLAEIERAGEFSPFPGMERIFTIAEGELAVLTIEGREHAVERFRPLRFDGGAKTSCALPTGTVKALNVFAEAGRYTASLLVVELSRKQPLDLGDGHIMVLLKGAASLHADGGEIGLSTFDAVLDADGCTVSGRGFAALISVMPTLDTSKGHPECRP